MEEENIIEISKWFPLATLYRPDGKQDYRFPSMTTRVINSPSWTEFDEFARDMIRTLTNQKVRMENVPIKEDKSKRIDNIGGFTNFSVGHRIERTENGGNI